VGAGNSTGAAFTALEVDSGGAPGGAAAGAVATVAAAALAFASAAFAAVTVAAAAFSAVRVPLRCASNAIAAAIPQTAAMTTMAIININGWLTMV
jgi:hypothetical protein